MAAVAGCSRGQLHEGPKARVARGEFMRNLTLGKPRGVLNPRAGKENLRLARYLPSEELGYFVEHYWVVAWDLRGREPYLSETLPHPCVHLVVEGGRSGVFGVQTGRFSRLLAGEGRVFGVKFRPGAFHPFWGSPVSGLTDRVIGLDESFGRGGKALAWAALAQEDEGAVVEAAESFLGGRLPERDANVEKINRITDSIVADRGIVRVEDLADRFGTSKRTLQRLFERYVGVSPKWVIRRYRLHEAAERLSGGEALDLAGLALELGYFDQAHFANDFGAIVGVAPGTYARRVRSTSS